MYSLHECYCIAPHIYKAWVIEGTHPPICPHCMNRMNFCYSAELSENPENRRSLSRNCEGLR